MTTREEIYDKMRKASDSKEFERLLNDHPDADLDFADKDSIFSMSLLHSFANDAFLPQTKLLLDRKANANTLDRYGWSALMIAAWDNQHDTAYMLITRGADVTRKSTRNAFGVPAGSTAKDIAAKQDDKEMLAILSLCPAPLAPELPPLKEAKASKAPAALGPEA
jgi:ankyrin repeat protein